MSLFLTHLTLWIASIYLIILFISQLTNKNAFLLVTRPLCLLFLMPRDGTADSYSLTSALSRRGSLIHSTSCVSEVSSWSFDATQRNSAGTDKREGKTTVILLDLIKKKSLTTKDREDNLTRRQENSKTLTLNIFIKRRGKRIQD